MDISSESFDTLWTQMYGRMCGFVCSRLSNPEDAEDILQEVFLRVYRQSGTVRDPERLESWIYQIARNRITDHYRRQRAWVDLTETLAAGEEPEEQMIQTLLPSVREMVNSLPEPYRGSLFQSDFQGMAQQDLADQARISLSGVKSRVQRARLKLKEALLRCFDFEFDTRGQVMNYRERCCC